VGKKVVLGSLQTMVLRDFVKERRVFEDKVVYALDVRHVDLVLHDDAPQLHELAPAGPRRMRPHLCCEDRLEDLNAAQARERK
jgi:hypothetical protein